MRMHTAAAALVGLLVVGACTAEPGPTEAPGPTSAPAPSSEPPTSGRSDLEPLTAPMQVTQIRWARGNVPRTVPEPDVALPSLLDDPPGRALVASYVPRPADGIEDEAIELYGVDGRWRRLDLGDLDLPGDRWPGTDTYAAGALSPDGRWWAGPMIDGMFLVDLRDGSTTALAGVQRRGGHASFDWSPDSDELALVLVGRSTRVSVPDLDVRRFPRPGAYPSLGDDGGWVECPSVRRVIAQCTTYGPDGTVGEERPVPEDLRERWAGPWVGQLDEAADAVFYGLPGSPYGNLRGDWEVLRTDADFVADARLVLPRGSEVNGVDEAFDDNTLGLAATGNRLELAWLVDQEELVKVIEPGVGTPGGAGQDFWDISFASGLVRLR